MGFLIACPICYGNFKDGRPYTGTSGVVFVRPHPLYEYCDAGLHFECLEKWAHREEFSTGYFLQKREMFQAMGTLLYEGSGWILGCGPALPSKEPYYAEIDLAEWPCRLYCRWQDWESFLSSSYRKGLGNGALESAEKAVVEVRELAPTLASLGYIRQERLAEQPNPSIERTRPGKPGRASHVKR